MKVDRYYNPYEDLERQCIEEADHIAKSLGGKMTKLTRADSSGRTSKVIEIEYDIEV
tara:strand:- start:15812 stop:15982 length:171 start_codon:yes stop_codon:yes gene_type:complete